MIGDELGDPAWLNDQIDEFLQRTGPRPETTLWMSFGRKKLLQIWLPEPDYILALKLLAGRPFDNDHIRALLKELHVNTRKKAQACLDRHSWKRFQEQEHVQEKLNKFFPRKRR